MPPSIDVVGQADEALALEAATEIAGCVVGPAAADVDRRGRFPKEAIDALREARLMSLLVPKELGGWGASASSASRVVSKLSESCSSTGLIYAMHLAQLGCVVRHGGSPYFEQFLRERIVRDQALLASATTEAGVGGDLRRSTCAIWTTPTGFHLEKTAPVISYGEYADAVLVTARSGPDAAANDQVLALCERPGLSLEPFGEWDTLGFRGTCSVGFHLSADGPREAVLPTPYTEIAEQTMVPLSHVLWSSAWLGMADAAVGQAHARVREIARSAPGSTPPGALRLAELVALRQQLAALVHGAADQYDTLRDDPEALEDMGYAIAVNGLKTAAADLVQEIACRALVICGLEGYRESGQRSVARIVRDSLGAALMVSNDRILAQSAQMLLVAKETL